MTKRILVFMYCSLIAVLKLRSGSPKVSVFLGKRQVANLAIYRRGLALKNLDKLHKEKLSGQNVRILLSTLKWRWLLKYNQSHNTRSSILHIQSKMGQVQ